MIDKEKAYNSDVSLTVKTKTFFHLFAHFVGPAFLLYICPHLFNEPKTQNIRSSKRATCVAYRAYIQQHSNLYNLITDKIF